MSALHAFDLVRLHGSRTTSGRVRTRACVKGTRRENVGVRGFTRLAGGWGRAGVCHVLNGAITNTTKEPRRCVDTRRVK